MNADDFAPRRQHAAIKIFPHMAQNMLTSCSQPVTRYLLHQTVEVRRAYATRPAKQQQMVNILDARGIVMDTSETRLSGGCFSLRVLFLCNHPGVVEMTWRGGTCRFGMNSLITDVMSSTCTLRYQELIMTESDNELVYIGL